MFLQILQGKLLQLVREIQNDLRVQDCQFHLGPNMSPFQVLGSHSLSAPFHMRNLRLNSTVTVRNIMFATYKVFFVFKSSFLRVVMEALSFSDREELRVDLSLYFFSL